jgi:uncharacterized protein (TIGR02996 family)
MGRADPFLDAILDEPDDRSHRLVYADWLDDSGQSDRAEFIRLQVGREALHPADPAVRAAVRREVELLAVHEQEWLGPLAILARRCRFHGGFVEEVSVTAEQLLAHGEELFRRAPVRRLNLRNSLALPNLLRDDPAAADRLAGLLGRVRVLDLNRDDLSEPAGMALLNLPRPPRLEALHLANNALSVAGVSFLAESPVLDGLTTLEFSSPSTEALEVLLRSPRLGRLGHLLLAGTRQGDRAVAVLIGSPVLARLRSLSLGHSNLPPDGLAELVASPRVAALESLDVSFNPLTVHGARSLTRSRYLGRLTSLNLSRCRLGDAGTAALASSPLFDQLYGLDLSLDRVGDEGALALARSGPPAAPGTLDLIYNPIGAAARRALARRFGEEVCLFTR